MGASGAGKILASVMALPIAGCAAGGSVYKDDAYKAAGAKPYEMATTDPFGKEGPWYAYDVAAENKIMISPTYAATVAMGMQGGAVRHAESFIPHQPFYESLATRYFTETGKPNCRIVRGYKVSHAQYEFLYDCSAPLSPIARKKRS